MSIFQKFLIIIALIIGLSLRLFNLNGPVADWHSHRQADTASVTRIFANKGIDLLSPHYHDLSNVQSGQENPQGYRLVELPVYNALSVNFHNLFHTNIEISSRLVSIVFSLGSSLLIFLICYQQTKTFLPSFLSLLVFLVLPFNVYYSRTILPEPAAVFFMLFTLYSFNINLLVSAISFALAILLKPYTGLIIFPTLLTLIFIRSSKFFNLKSILKLSLFSLISLVPFISWRLWIGHHPEGIPQSDWLLNNGVTTTFPTWFHGYNLSFLNKLIAFRPHWWEWLFKQRISDLILGGFGLIPLFLGTVYKKNQTQKFSFSLILGILFYFIIVAQGNIQHDYYQVLIIPSLSILSGFGYFYILRYTQSSRLISSLSLLAILTFSLYFSWNQVKGYYQIDNPNIVNAGLKAQEILPKNSLIVAPYNGDTAFLYQTGFSGWPTEIYDIPQLASKFPNRPIYFISVNYDTYTNSLIPKYPTIFKNKDFIILKLTP